MTQKLRHDAGLKTAGRSIGGRYKAHERLSAAPFFPSEVQLPLVTDEAIQVADMIETYMPHASVTVDESPIFDHNNPAGNVMILAGNECIGIGDLMIGRLSDEERTVGVLARAEHVIDLDRTAQLLRTPITLMPELDAIRDQELIDLSMRVTEFQLESRWAPGNLLLVGDGPVVVMESSGSVTGDYQVTVERQNGKVLLTQTVTGAHIPGLAPETVSNYRREIQDFLSDSFYAEVTVLSDGSFEATCTQQLTDGLTPTLSTVTGELECTNAIHLQDYGTGVTRGFDPNVLRRYLAEHEVIDNSRFVDVRNTWLKDESPLKRAETIGFDRLDAEEWVTAAWTTQAASSVTLLPSPMRDFLYRGRVDRTALQETAEQISELSDTEDAFVTLCGHLAEKLSQGGLIDRPAPRMVR